MIVYDKVTKSARPMLSTLIVGLVPGDWLGTLFVYISPIQSSRRVHRRLNGGIPLAPLLQQELYCTCNIAFFAPLLNGSRLVAKEVSIFWGNTEVRRERKQQESNTVGSKAGMYTAEENLGAKGREGEAEKSERKNCSSGEIPYITTAGKEGRLYK